MQTTASYTPQQTRSGSVQALVIKATIAVCLIAYSIYQFSTGHLVLIALISGLLLAVLSRLDNINSIDAGHHKRAANSTSFDGGTYNRKQLSKDSVCATPATNDGGSFGHSSLTSKAKG